MSPGVPMSAAGPGASCVCTNLDIDMSRASFGQTQRRHKYQLDNVGDSLLQFSRVMAQIQCDTYFTHPLKTFTPFTSFQKLVWEFYNSFDWPDTHSLDDI